MFRGLQTRIVPRPHILYNSSTAVLQSTTSTPSLCCAFSTSHQYLLVVQLRSIDLSTRHTPRARPRRTPWSRECRSVEGAGRFLPLRKPYGMSRNRHDTRIANPAASATSWLPCSPVASVAVCTSALLQVLHYTHAQKACARVCHRLRRSICSGTPRRVECRRVSCRRGAHDVICRASQGESRAGVRGAESSLQRCLLAYDHMRQSLHRPRRTRRHQPRRRRPRRHRPRQPKKLWQRRSLRRKSWPRR